MSNKDMRFRTAAFGGFQKQDVLDYLERSAKEQADKYSAIQKQLEASESARTEAEERLDTKEAAARRLTEENRRLSADLAERGIKLAEAEAKITALSAQVSELSAQVQRLTPGAEAYEGLKDRAAGIELDAHSRAHGIEAEAKAKAKKTQAEIENWFVQLQATYHHTKDDLNTVLSHVKEELVSVEKSIEGLAGELETHSDALREMKHSVESIVGPKAPQPLPLEEPIHIRGETAV